MKLNRLFVFLLILFLSGCAGQPDKILVKPLEYTDERIRSTEIQLIESELEKNPIVALEKAVHLYDAASFDENVLAIYSKCEDKIFDLLNKELEKEKPEDSFLAWKYYHSLKVCGSKLVENPEYSDELMYQKAIDRLIGDNVLLEPTTKPAEKPNISEFINGTVTIWVDLGVKIENGKGYAERVIGSGFFIDKRGYLITNCHVVEKHVDPKYQGFSRVYIKLADDSETRIPTKVVGWDPALDLALLKTEIDPQYIFYLGTSSDVNIGEKIYAIGSPVGLERTLTSGIVSAFDRKLFSVASVIQIDAAVNTGNSGGPIIDELGNVQGVVFAGMQQFEGLNFAIPVEYLKITLPYLYNGGKVEHSWCGAYGRTKKEIPTSQKGIGVEVLYVMTTGGAFYAGIKPGDVILSIAKQPVETIEQMQNALLLYLPDTIVEFECLGTDGVKQTKKVKLSARPDMPGSVIYEKEPLQRWMYPLVGMELIQVSDIRQKFSITSIIPGSIADESGFSVNDSVEINNPKLLLDKGAVYAEVYAKKRKNGYLDVALVLAAPLDSTFIF